MLIYWDIYFCPMNVLSIMVSRKVNRIIESYSLNSQLLIERAELW